MKKVITLTLLFTCMLAVNAQSFVAMTNGKRLCFNVLSESDKTVEVSFRKNVRYTDTHYVIPSTIEYGGETYTVVAIGEKAFCDNKKIESIEFPNTIRTIGESAFDECKSLTKIVFSEGLINIEERAFEKCTHLEELILPDGLEIIGEKAFAFCPKLTDVKFPVGLKRIEDIAFGGSNLEIIDIPNTVTYIGVRAFLTGTGFIAKDSKTQWISIPESVLEIGKEAFCKFVNKCHVELLPSWVDEEEAKRIGIKREAYKDYVKSK